MDITKSFERTKESLAVSQLMAVILKDYTKKAITLPVLQHLLVRYLKKV